MSDEIEQALEQGDWTKIREFVLQEEELSRQQVGLEQCSDLTSLQAAALYKPEVARRMVPRQECIDLHTKVLLELALTSVNVSEFADYVEGFSPIGMAAYRGLTDSIKLLLQHGDDVNRPQGRAGFYVWETEAMRRGIERWTPLHIATLHGYLVSSPQCIEVLCKNGADIDAFNTYGAQAIHLAATHGWLKNLEVLLSMGAHVDALTEPINEDVQDITGTPMNVPTPQSGITPLMVAIQEGFTSVVEYLLAHGADVNFTTTDGYSPLHLAAKPWWRENIEIVEMLLAHGGDKTSQNHADQSPYDLARFANNWKTARLLKAE